MKWFNIAVCTMVLSLYLANNFEGYADNADVGDTKRIDMPFIHIGVKRHSDGTKDVDVKAPFVNVHNPAGDNNAQIKAPFTKVNNASTVPAKQPVNSTNTTKVETYSTITKTK